MRTPKLILALLTLGAAAMRGEVIDSSANGFTVKTTLTIKAAPADVYRKLVSNIGDWWSPQHTMSGDARNLRIEDHPGGCFCEKLPDNGFTKHMDVVYLAPNKRLVMRGALGPMQTMGVAGAMTIQLSPVDESTKLEVTYAIAGYMTNGMQALAGVVDMVLAQQFTRLKNYVETGNAVPAPTPKE